jgi:hypothetical protein
MAERVPGPLPSNGHLREPPSSDHSNTPPRSANGQFLFDFARLELEDESSIDPDVIAERGYESIHRPTNGDQRQRDRRDVA